MNDKTEEKINREIPKYSTDINAAMRVVVKIMKDYKMSFTLYSPSSETNNKWVALFRKHIQGKPIVEFNSVGESPAHAICLAALEVVDGIVNGD